MKQTRFFVFLLVTIFCFSGCQTDNEVEPIPQTIRQIVSAEDIPNVTSALLQRMGLGNGSTKFSVNNGTSQIEYDIVWDEILQLVDTTGRETYTFNISDSDNDPFTFYNLVLKFNEFGDAYFPFIMRYEMSEGFIPEYQVTGSLENFSGKVTKTVISIPASYSNQSSYYADPNAPRMINENPDCPNGEIDMNNGNGNTGGGGPSGPINTGGTTGYTVY